MTHLKFPVSFEREGMLFSDYWLPPNPSPLLTVLNYSCGRQSHRIARGLLNGEIPFPKKLLVLSADPGNEHKDTIRIRDKTLAEFRERGIHALVAPGPKMLEDLKERKAAGATRIDNSALWTESGGQSPQKCTRYYKIAPMDRAVRAYLAFHMGVRYPRRNSVERWVGFSWDEQSRCKPMQQGYQQVRWPLIEMGETKEDIIEWYKRTGEEMPPPSVCNHCWANGTNTFKRIYETDPVGFERAIEFDENSRDRKEPMTHPSKRKGNRYESELRDQAKDSGLEAERAWGSNGKSLGMHEEVDLVVEGYKIQAKRRKSIASYITPSDHVDAVAARGDGECGLIVMLWWEWLNMVKEIKNLKEKVDRLERRSPVAQKSNTKDKDTGTAGTDSGAS